MTLRETEFQVLRDTIAWRGTMRQCLLPVTVIGWSLTAGLLLAFDKGAAASLFSLGVLVSGFEAIHALHVGVERIGRYLQVFYENGGEGPLWESAAMRFGPGLPGAGIDPLFTSVFVGAAIINAAILPRPVDTVWDGVAIAAHVAFLVRAIRARRAAAQQRAVDLETFTAIRAQLTRNGVPGTGNQGPNSLV